ncbi:hypothetical protein Trydic_g18886 [Trypoxylus dichotomus]
MTPRAISTVQEFCTLFSDGDSPISARCLNMDSDTLIEEIHMRMRDTDKSRLCVTEAERETFAAARRMSASKVDDEKRKMETTPGPSKKSAREERRARRRGETVDSIRLLQEALPLATDSTTDDSDDCSTIGNTSTAESAAESAMDTDEFQTQSARRQRKRKNSNNSSSGSDERKRPGKKSVTEEVFQPVQSAPSRPQAKDARVPPVVLREKARWMAVNAELVQQGVRTTKVVNTNVGIRIQPASAADYRQLIRIVSVMKVQYHSYQLTEEKPLKIVIRGVSEEITEEEVAQDLASQGFQHASCKRMLVGTERRSTPLVFVQLTKNDEAKKIFGVTHVCGMNVTIESKRVKKDQVTQCHRCQLYGHGQRNCHAAAVCVKCAGPHQTAECTKPRDVPAKCALCSGPHTASYKGCPKSPYNNQREAPAKTSGAETGTASSTASGTEEAGNPNTTAPAPKSGPHADGDGRPKAVYQLREALLRRRSEEHRGETSGQTRGETRGEEAKNAGETQSPRCSPPTQASAEEAGNAETRQTDQDGRPKETRPERPQDECHQDGTRRHEHVGHADPPLPKDQLDQDQEPRLDWC